MKVKMIKRGSLERMMMTSLERMRMMIIIRIQEDVSFSKTFHCEKIMILFQKMAYVKEQVYTALRKAKGIFK